MFIAFDEKTGKFKTGRDHPKLLLVNINAVDKNRAKLEAGDMPPLIFELPKTDDKTIMPVVCRMWWDELGKCLDCGSEVSKWLSRYFSLNTYNYIFLNGCLFKLE